MPTVTTLLQTAFRGAIQAAYGVDIDPLIGPAQNEKFGDYQANFAMSLAKQLSDSPTSDGKKTNPREIGQRIRDALVQNPQIAPDGTPLAAAIEVAGPGFVNIRLSEAFIASQLQAARRDADRLAIDRSDVVITTVVDYSGPNVAKEMHVGHLRSTIIGDAISRVLEFRGEKIIRQNHI